MTQKQAQSLSDLLAPHARLVETDLERWLAADSAPATLAQAMRYCALGGGKRLRPALVLMSASAVGGAEDDLLARRSAAAVEMVHCYSLVHDDLPAMDDDVLRRGRPTAHVRFGQAMAILAGDALLTRAFGVLASDEHLPGQAPGAGDSDGRIALLVAELAQGAGETGMIAGQVADMDLCAVPGGEEGLRYIHSRKTAALIRAAVRMGAICGRADPKQLEAVSAYGEQIGQAFQLVDDLLDATGEAADLGKTPGKDAQSGKRTHLSQMGHQAASILARQQTARAILAIAPLGPRAEGLIELARRLAERTH